MKPTRGPGGRRRRRLAFSAQTLLLQLAVVALVVLGMGGVYGWLTYQQLTGDAENRALILARVVAAEEAVRSGVTTASEASHLPSAATLRAGPLQALAEQARLRTGSLFVVITDDDGFRLSHPNPEQIGRRVSTSPAAALEGHEVVNLALGTLGMSARAKVPIWSTGSPRRVVGEVSAGFSTADIAGELGAAAIPISAAVLAALAIGALASAFLVRRLRTLTLGLEPEEIATLVQDQEVVLHGVAEGVIGVAPDGRVTVCTAKARRLLRLSDATGRQFSTLRVPAPVTDLVGDYSGAPTKTARVVVGHSVLLVSGRHVVRGNRDLGWVITVLDRTQVEQLTQQLDAVGALSTALRVQRHEFANRLHTIAGLLHLGDADEAARFVRHTIDSGPLKFPVEHADRLQDPYLQAFLGAKGFELAERGVLLRIGAETLLTRPVEDPEDLTTVLGNLIDNATEAAVRASGEERWVEVELMNDDQVLHVVVADSGDGIAGNQDLPFAEGHSTRASGVSDGHGQGLGLPLSRRLARNRGGDVWLADAGAPGGHGAVFCARLPGILGAGAVEEAGRA